MPEDFDFDAIKKLIEENENTLKRPAKDLKRSAREKYRRRRKAAAAALDDLAAAADEYAAQPGKIKGRARVQDTSKRVRELQDELDLHPTAEPFDDTVLRETLGLGPETDSGGESA